MKVDVPRPITILTWFYCLLIGVVTGLVALATTLGVSAIFKGAYTHVVRDVFSGAALGLPVGAVVNLGCVLGSACLVLFVAPAAAGSGVAVLSAYLNGIDVANFLSLRVALAKIPGSVLTVMGGLALGKEGPLLHIGSIIASWLGKTWLFKGMGASRDPDPFSYDQHLRDLVLCGAAAGLAAGFGAPVGGVLFAMELSTRWRAELSWRCLFTSAVTATVVKTGVSIFSRECPHGSCGFLTYGSLVFFNVDFPTPFGQTLLMVVLGLLGGMMGSLFTTLNTMWLGAARSRYRCKVGLRLLDLALVALVTVMLRHTLPWLGSCLPFICSSVNGDGSGVCRAPGVEEIQRFHLYGCKDDQYNDLAVLLFNPHGHVLRTILTLKVGQLSGISLLIFTLYYYIMSALSFGAAVPAGLFTPSLLTGGAMGHLFAFVLNKAFDWELDPGLYGMLGGAAILGGIYRLAVSFCVILVELFSARDQIPFLILVLVFAKGIADRFNHSLLHHKCILLGLPFVGFHPESTVKRKGFTTGHIMTQDFTKLKLKEPMSVLEKALEADEFGVFPVVKPQTTTWHSLVASEERFLGMALAEDIARLLDKHAGGDGCSDTEADIGGVQDLDVLIDLSGIVQLPPVVLPTDMQLTKAFLLKNASGLEFIPIVDDHGPIKGMLTRRELVDAQNRFIDPLEVQQRLDRLTTEPFECRSAVKELAREELVPLLRYDSGKSLRRRDGAKLKRVLTAPASH